MTTLQYQCELQRQNRNRPRATVSNAIATDLHTLYQVVLYKIPVVR